MKAAETSVPWLYVNKNCGHCKWRHSLNALMRLPRETFLFSTFLEGKLFQTNAVDSNKCISCLVHFSDIISHYEMIKWDLNIQKHRYEKLRESCCALCIFPKLIY